MRLEHNWSCVFATALAVGLLALGSGCSLIRKEVGRPLVVDPELLSTARDCHAVLELMGPPHRLSVNDAGMVFLYEDLDLDERQLGISLSTQSVSLFKATLARGSALRRLLLVFFDASGRTQAVSFDEHQEDLARGAALQFVFTVVGVVDDSDLAVPSAAYDWGGGLLEPDLAVALNAYQDLDRGSAGLEQTATPRSVGQRTLELTEK